jgi:hypothetical protein
MGERERQKERGRERDRERLPQPRDAVSTLKGDHVTCMFPVQRSSRSLPSLRKGFRFSKPKVPVHEICWGSGLGSWTWVHLGLAELLSTDSLICVYVT